MKKLFSKKNVAIMWSLVLMLVLAVGCSSTDNNQEKTNGDAQQKETQSESKEITVKHELGETKIEKTPQRVIIFDFGTLDTLDQLGVDIVGLPKANVPEIFSKYKDDKYTDVGGLKEPNFETIYELKPDLIIIGGRQASMYDEFAKIAPTIYADIDSENYIGSFSKNAKTLGEIFDKESEVEAGIKKIEKRMAEVNKKATESGKKSLILMANDGSLSVYGKGSRFDIIHNEFGFAPIDENIEASGHGDKVTFEYIAEKDPDYIFVIDRTAVVGGDTSAKDTLENDIVKNTKAYKDGKIIYLDSYIWYIASGGLDTTLKMIDDVERVF